MSQRARAVCLFAFAAWLGGCAVGPDFVRPTAPNVDGYTPEALAPTVTGSTTRTTFRSGSRFGRSMVDGLPFQAAQ
jgi:hypothetical protein